MVLGIDKRLRQHAPRVKKKEKRKKKFRLDLNELAFICAGLSNVGS